MGHSQEAPGYLALADGTVFHGQAFGRVRRPHEAVIGEVVFNTSMFGYQEILTDPSYAGQVMCFTCPHIGNVGCNDEDVESGRIHTEAVVCRSLSPVVSNFRARQSLSEYLDRTGVMGLTGIDTRRIVQHLRDNGAQMGALAAGEGIDTDELVDRARAAGSMAGKEYVTTVTCAEPYTWNELPWSLDRRGEGRVSDERLVSRPHVVALDCGIKHNILRILVETGFRVTVVPATTTATNIMALRPDGLFLSNGPGDPATLGFIVSAVKEVLGKVPIFGICLGHQILGQVAGGKTYKLKFGHRGGNHPVRDDTTGKVEITVQNHGFAVDPTTLPGDVRITHVNLNDETVEGLELAGARAFSVQYHPEASPGPHDSRYLFRRFFENVVDYKRA